jgi:uncharacterized protein HemX
VVFNTLQTGNTSLVDEEKELTPVPAPTLESEEAAASAEGYGQAGAPTPKKSRLRAWLGYATLLFVLILVGAGLLLLQELRSKQEGLGSGLDKGDKQMQELLHQVSGLQTELAAVHSQLATVQSQVTTEDSKFERAIGEQGASFGEKLGTAKSELEQAIQHIQRQMNKTRGDLMIADAEYLLSIANQKLHLVGDVKTVLAAMEAADQRLHDSGDPGVFKVREALAEEINLLKGLNPPDVVGASAKLLALEAKVKEIPLFLPHSERAKEQHEPAKESQPAAEGEGDLLGSTLKDLQGLVTVRRTDRPVQAILLPEEVEALRQVLLLKLEMARAALLRGDDVLYKTNLESAQSWLHEHFDHEAAFTRGVAEDINALQTLQIRVPFPDIGKSLSLLRNIEKLRLEAEKAEGGEGSTVKPEAGAQP